MRTLLSAFAALLLALGTVPAQNGDLSFVHGLPGLPGPVDVAVNGNMVFSGLSFGDLQTTQLTAGSYLVDVLDASGAPLLSMPVTLGAAESHAVVAHLDGAGAATLSVIQNNLTTVEVFGNGRVTLHHLANAGPFIWGIQSPSLFSLSAIGQNGDIIGFEALPGTYDLFAIDPMAFTFPVPASATLASGLGLAADAGLDIFLVGDANTGTLTAIAQSLSLPPAMPLMPGMCDLTVSGSFVGGSTSAGGTLNLSITGATPNAFCGVFFALDNTPVTVFDIPLGIGGGGGLGVISSGFADASGNYTDSIVYGPQTTVNPLGGPAPPPFLLDIYTQGASFNFTNSGYAVLDCVSDIESFQVSIP